MGFTALNICVAILSLGYSPALYYLRDMHDYQPYEDGGQMGDGGGVRIGDPPDKEYQTIALQEKPLMNNGYDQSQQYQETNFQEEQQMDFNQTKNPFKAQQQSNPFRK